jgi:hypothetical protein
MIAKYEKTRAEKYAQNFGTFEALNTVSHSLLTLEFSKLKGRLHKELLAQANMRK